MTNLSVNLNKVAMLRNARPLTIPSVVKMGEISIAAGAHGLTVHPRPDERHIRRTDVYDIFELLKKHPGIEYNIEGNPFESPFMEIIREVKPDQCTLVPDAPNQNTSDHGWDVVENKDRLKDIIQELNEIGCRVSLFMDADVEQIERVPDLGCSRIELYTEPYATAYREGHGEESFKIYEKAAKCAQDLGLGVNGGHDLNLDNLPLFQKIPNLLEVSIGHALTADALEMGYGNAVKAYLDVLKES
ncbi:MAG: pyridoxine 5'-phosphate synthase [Leptolyngbya foveolarum]|uniref:Pyridoxine 5'-phosphate synthase n=1 Tax=Leptolyngbya foveolarum TaxID=47253 RepID=A0A2W4WDP9_9CYAN|nr:MAG: pyridoxine 5'-phosphate synthase [Leptolyngbya foveolarum]